MRTFASVVLLALATFSGDARQQPSAPVADSLTLAGRVVTGSAPDIRPVRRAKVTLAGRGLASPRVTDTDTKGAYRFDRLSPGEYTVTIQKPGFVTLVSPAQPNATLKMERGSAIEGVVTAAGGDPAWNVVVSALSVAAAGEKPQLAAQARTDDLGRYRLHSLAEGDYYVEATTDARFLQSVMLLAGEKRPEVTRTYYPDAPVITDAKPVRVSAGLNARETHLALRLGPPVKDPAAAPPAPLPDATGTGRIAGRVVDATTGKPIGHARLLLVPVDGDRLTNWTRSDAQGRFEYTSLQPRRYTLRAEAERFARQEFGQQKPGEAGKEIQLRDGETFAADMKLPRAGALEGTVLDEFGEPAPNVTLQLARKQYAAGRQRLMPAGGRYDPPVTDDTGHYRISAVTPGEYFVIGLSGVYTDVDGAPGFAPTYYPGTPDASAAAPVTLTSGLDTVATFALAPAKTVTVSGTMVDANGSPVAGRGMLWLATPDRLGRMDFTLARGSTAPDGRFVLRNVPEGSYTLQGFGPPPPDYRGPGNINAAMPFGWLPLTVGDADVDNLAIKVTSGTALRGRVVTDDAALPPPKPNQVRVSTVPIEFDSAPVGGGPEPSETRDDLSFEVRKLSGIRRILVSVSSPDWTLKRITFNKLDITDAPVDFRAKDIEDVEVALTSRVSRITGRVSDDKGPIADYTVVVFPSDPGKWVDRSRFLLTARPTQNMQFDLRGVPPEDYLLIALPYVEATEWQDPEFLQQLRAQATPLLLMDGETKSVELKLKKRP